MKKNKIGIVGVGIVGGAVAHYFKSAGHMVFLYDKYKSIGSSEQVNRSDIIFVCVPTPFIKKKGFDLSSVEDVFKVIKGKKIIVIKSTVWPGTTEKFQKKYTQHKILFNPEFLSEASADKDMQYPDVQVVGYTKKSRLVAKEILRILPKAPFQKIIRAAEAEMFKYFHNVHGALKVVFANQMYNLCQALKIDYDVIKECAAASKHILTDTYLNIWHGGYRGYGGSCFPKDVRTLIQLGDSAGVNLELLKIFEKINNQLMKAQGIRDPEQLGIKNQKVIDLIKKR